MTYSLPQRALAELLGTALLVFVGTGSIVATLVLAGDSSPALTGADLLGISFAFGLVIAALVYAIGRISGCHINPAVTVALAVGRRFPWREVPAFVGAQLIGGVLGSLGVWAVYRHTGIELGMGGTSFDSSTVTWASAMASEAIGVFVLVYAIAGIVDKDAPGSLSGIVIGGVVVAIIMVVAPVAGAALNPARTFGPAIVSELGGGTTDWNQFLPVYVLPSVVGGGLAIVVYDLLNTPRSRVRSVSRGTTIGDEAIERDAVAAP